MTEKNSRENAVEVTFGEGDSDTDTDTGFGVGVEGGDDERGMPEVSVALSFEKVVERLTNPAEAIDTVAMWAEYVGMPSDKPQHVVNGFCSKRDIHIDFFTAPDAGKLDTLERAKNEMGMDADRHIYVGASKRDEVIAKKAGWEYMSFEEVVENMSWEVKEK